MLINTILFLHLSNGYSFFNLLSRFFKVFDLLIGSNKSIFMWLDYLDNIGAPPTNAQIERSANYLLSKDFTGPGEPPCAGKTWIYDFDRLPEQYIRIV